MPDAMTSDGRPIVDSRCQACGALESEGGCAEHVIRESFYCDVAPCARGCGNLIEVPHVLCGACLSASLRPLDVA